MNCSHRAVCVSPPNVVSMKTHMICYVQMELKPKVKKKHVNCWYVLWCSLVCKLIGTIRATIRPHHPHMHLWCTLLYPHIYPHTLTPSHSQQPCDSAGPGYACCSGPLLGYPRQQLPDRQQLYRGLTRRGEHTSTWAIWRWGRVHCGIPHYVASSHSSFYLTINSSWQK